MKIMHFAGGGDIGGAKTHILSLGVELSKENDYHLISFRPGAFAEEAKAMGLDVIVAENAWNLIGCLKTALAAIDRYQPDIIHCHGAKANMLGIMAKVMRKIPIATTVHSNPSSDYLGMPFKQHSFGFINNLALRKMDYYMAVAGQMEETLIKRGANPQKIFVIHNGLDFSSADDNFNKGDNPGRDIVVGIAARLTPIKDIPTLLKAFAKAQQRNPQLKLKIAGIGESEKSLRALSHQLGIEQRVEFVGWATNMRQFFATVDINVLCSLSETFPYSLLEGAYEHCAVISSAVGGIPELIEHNNTGLLFQPGDVDVLADYLYQLSTDSVLRKKLAENLYLRAKNEYSLEHMHQVQIESYQTMLRKERNAEQRNGTVICGAYGRNNAGDEAILQAIISQMQEIDKDMPITVMSRDKMGTRLANRTNSMFIFNIWRFVRELRRAKNFINGGGSLIQDATSSRSLLFYLFTLWCARVCGCNVIMYGCGIGPVSGRMNRRITTRILNNNVDIITLRDSISMTELVLLGVDNPIVQLAADPTVGMPTATPERLAEILQQQGIESSQPLIGFCVRKWSSFTKPEYVAEAADYAYKKYGFLPVFIPIELPRDVQMAEHVAQFMQEPHHIVNRRFSTEELIALLGSMKLVVGMRLHSLIFATVGHAPVIGISYDVKIDSFIRDIGSTACIPVESLTVDQLKQEIDRIVAGGCKRADSAAEQLRSSVEININAVKTLLSQKQ